MDLKLPRTGGRNVRQWYEEAARLESEARPPAWRRQVHKAFQVMGMSAVPHLLDQLEAVETCESGGAQLPRKRGWTLKGNPRLPLWIRKLMPSLVDPSPALCADLFAEIGTNAVRAPNIETRLAALLSKWPESQHSSLLEDLPLSGNRRIE